MILVDIENGLVCQENLFINKRSKKPVVLFRPQMWKSGLTRNAGGGRDTLFWIRATKEGEAEALSNACDELNSERKLFQEPVVAGGEVFLHNKNDWNRVKERMIEKGFPKDESMIRRGFKRILPNGNQPGNK
ncbi:hypothetical protein A3D77_00695 [Candidatus Gottesmanbacteria bacterium RIFCSPHIGHO2_02_FULL_39_11]|uniref:Uncharacterized protein n=1 Tax=Candidatus Gottesmanbacteria bacterium RIFCSPHIGHO2_02_FULL_39_11 TaxID=1798382 RepID=A0A1F5ZLM3_9BACT|nr:MAG: hypothetical protein A3D77_00695 [Candidatus Gottesmanbacteria bacterium RIFCSPHIGHO2_02_FULL_39_11]